MSHEEGGRSQNGDEASRNQLGNALDIIGRPMLSLWPGVARQVWFGRKQRPL